MTFDLFAEPIQPTGVRKTDAPVGRVLVNPMVSVQGDPGRWVYRSEVIVHDGRRAGQGAWWTVEAIGRPRVESDDLAVVLAAVDLRAVAGADSAA